MFDALFDELAAMKDAWGMDAKEALEFIAENREMYDGPVGDQFDTFLGIMEAIYENDTVVLH